MFTYLVSYDLGREPKLTYLQLISAVKGLGKARRAQFSTWIVTTTLNEVEIRNELMRLLDGNDSLLVIKISSSPYAYYNMDHSMFG